jgi:hypothetical protein
VGRHRPVLGISLIGWFWFSPHLYASSWNPHGLALFHGISASIAVTLRGPIEPVLQMSEAPSTHRRTGRRAAATVGYASNALPVTMSHADQAM